MKLRVFADKRREFAQTLRNAWDALFAHPLAGSYTVLGEEDLLRLESDGTATRYGDRGFWYEQAGTLVIALPGFAFVGIARALPRTMGYTFEVRGRISTEPLGGEIVLRKLS